MSLLIINTMSEDDESAQNCIQQLIKDKQDYKVIHTENMKINPCIGCNACWLKTPGICAIKDDYEEILKAYLQYDTVLFLSETSLGFVRYPMKNVIDRILPLATMYICVVDGQMRHVPRYKKKITFGLIYKGMADQDYLSHWMERVALNMHGTSIGAFTMEQIQERQGY